MAPGAPTSEPTSQPTSRQTSEPTSRPSASLPMSALRLHIVTGKGGTGKTTVASALALALAREGKRVLLTEVEGRQGISQTFDIAPLSTEEEVRILADRSGGELYGLSVDAKPALLEYLQKFYHLGRAGAMLERFGAIDFATTIAPGVRDVLLIGKVYEAAGRRQEKSGELVYDAVVLDAPPTGRVVRFLNVNAEVADVARVGPIRAQADSITRMLRHGSTAVHMVTLLEEMPVQETVDTLAELRRASLRPGAVFVNQVREPLLADTFLAAAGTGRTGKVSTGISRDLRSVGIGATTAMVSGLIAEAAEHADRVSLQREQAEVVTGLGLPVVRLPALAEGMESGGIRVLADEIRDQLLRDQTPRSELLGDQVPRSQVPRSQMPRSQMPGSQMPGSHVPTGQGRTGQGRAGQGRAGQRRTGGRP